MSYKKSKNSIFIKSPTKSGNLKNNIIIDTIIILLIIKRITIQKTNDIIIF